MPDLLRKKFLGEEESKNRPATRQSSIRGWSSTASNLSHELRTPLTSMKSSLSLVLSGDAGPVGADQSHFLNMVMRNVNRLERLIDDRLGTARSVGNDPAPVMDLSIGFVPGDGVSIERDSKATTPWARPSVFFVLPTHLSSLNCPNRIVKAVSPQITLYPSLLEIVGWRFVILNPPCSAHESTADNLGQKLFFGKNGYSGWNGIICCGCDGRCACYKSNY